MPADPERLQRDSARVVVLDGAGRVLLFETFDDYLGRSFWITPGGGLEPGESPAQTATRELFEETGLLAPPGAVFGPVAVASGEWEFRGTPLAWTDTFFACVVDALTIDDRGWTPLEREFTRSWRWWHPDELDATDETIFPVGLAELARRLRRGERFEVPASLAWRQG